MRNGPYQVPGPSVQPRQMPSHPVGYHMPSPAGSRCELTFLAHRLLGGPHQLERSRGTCRGHRCLTAKRARALGGRQATGKPRLRAGPFLALPGCAAEVSVKCAPSVLSESLAALLYEHALGVSGRSLKARLAPRMYPAHQPGRGPGRGSYLVTHSTMSRGKPPWPAPHTRGLHQKGGVSKAVSALSSALIQIADLSRMVSAGPMCLQSEPQHLSVSSGWQMPSVG